MTTVAWDGVTLAADQLRMLGDVPVRATKIFSAKAKDGSPILYGCAGDSYDATAFRRWVEGGPKHVPTSLAVLAIDAHRRIWLLEEKLHWLRVPLDFFAIGSGAHYAIAAMACNRSSSQAVQLAQRFDVNTGIGVDALRFPTGARP